MAGLPPHSRFMFRHRAARRQAAYRLHMLIALAASLTLVFVLTQLPLYRVPMRVGWDAFVRQHDIVLEEERKVEEEATDPGAGVPVTTFGEEEEEEVREGEEDTPAEEAVAEEEGSPLPDIPLERMVLAYAEEMPTIQGGLGAYYINIEYPHAAIEAGIQGRLILDFVVETDGRPTEIKVIKPLHPLCDSAAVRALKMTRFMPGRQNGELVPVRMRLPVTFRLIDAGERSSTPPDTTSTR